MAAGLDQCTALQSRARPADRSGSHYRNGFGVVSLSQNLAEETQRVIHGGAPFHSASASPTGYAPAERNSVLSTLTSLGVGQIKPPKWARPTCQKQEFCNPARGNEKGGVEGEVGYFRRNHLVPIPQAQNLEELNEQLRSYCQQDEQRRIAGKAMPVGEALWIEREHLLPLTAEGFELAETSFPTVDSKGCVKVRTNFYSTPLRPGTRPQAKLLPAYVEIWQERECVARHERSFGRYEQVLDLEHYLDVLEKKPGALAGSSPLRQWRERGRWPESFDRLWLSLQEPHGKQVGTREMIELLTVGKRYGWDRLQQAVEKALGLGCTDAAAVRHLLTATELSRPRNELLELNGLERYQRPLPLMNEYDQLLSIAASTAEVAR